MADCQIIAFHGWAFTGDDWEKWEKELSQYGVFQAYNRGYFGNPREIDLAAEPKKTVLISHSFGLHMLNEKLVNRADLLVIISGFLQFHPYAAQYKRRSRLILQEMINNLEVNPEKVLREFYENCYAPQKAPDRDVSDLNHQLLLDDLRSLHTSELNPGKLKKADKICILHGSEDHIVPKKKGREIYTQLQHKAQYFEIKGAGHALPFAENKRQCLEFVRSEIAELQKINA